MMNWSFLAPARDELEEAARFYDRRRAGLGDEFVEEVERTIKRILDHPKAWHSLSPRTRRCRTRRFAYGVVYQIRGDEILIVAIMHLKRRPGYRRDRFQGA